MHCIDIGSGDFFILCSGLTGRPDHHARLISNPLLKIVVFIWIVNLIRMSLSADQKSNKFYSFFAVGGMSGYSQARSSERTSPAHWPPRNTCIPSLALRQ